MFKVLRGEDLGAQKLNCRVSMDDSVESFTDFVTVGHNPMTGTTTLMQNADTITLGRAVRMTSAAFLDSYNALSAEDRVMVNDVLNPRRAANG